jgi:predicted nucleotidyltransferase
MRLKKTEIESIKRIVAKHDPSAKIYLYGSRIDNDKKGGDIDLLIISNKITSTLKRKIRLELYEDIGEQKIDIIISENIIKPFVKIAYNEGVLL